jgi:hypothetical protein
MAQGFSRRNVMMGQFRFGRRKFIAPKACMRFRDYQTLAFPETPLSGSYRPAATNVLGQMYLNDELGDCVIAWMAKAVGVFLANAGVKAPIFTREQIVAMYGAIGGYVNGDAATDQGCDENTALDYWLATGFEGHKIAGVLSVDATNRAECASAVWLFENLMFGVGLPAKWTEALPNASGFVWDVAGDSVPENGHCFGSCSWGPDGLGIETWGLDGTITYDAVAKYAVASAGGQLFSVITSEALNRATLKAPNGFDFAQLSTDFAGLGGTIGAGT